MSDTSDREIIYKKLVRDRIPDLLKQAEKRAQISKLTGESLKRAVADKILEKSHELFRAFRSGERTDILKGSADLVEIVAAGLEHFGLNESDLCRAREKRDKERGAFRKGICLEKVGTAGFDGYHIQPFPEMFVDPVQDDDLINLTKSELNQFSTCGSKKVVSALNPLQKAADLRGVVVAIPGAGMPRSARMDAPGVIRGVIRRGIAKGAEFAGQNLLLPALLGCVWPV